MTLCRYKHATMTFRKGYSNVFLFKYFLHAAGEIHHSVLGQVVHKGKDHTVSGGNSQLGTTGRERQQDPRGQDKKKNCHEDAHVDVHFIVSG